MEWSIDMLVSEEELCHHGIKGQKWGVRRFQKKDGSLTPTGKKRYNDDEYDEERKKEGLSDKDGTIKPKKKSKPVRVAKSFVKAFARDTVTGFATAALINHGHEEVGKMIAMVGGAASWTKLGKDIYDVVTDKD